MIKTLCLLFLVTSGCAYNAQPFVVNPYPVETIEGHCPSTEESVLTDLTIIPNEMQMNFPEESFIGNPEIGQRIVGPMETIEMYLMSQDTSAMGMIWIRFSNGIKEDLLAPDKDNFYFSKTDEQDALFSVGGCAGPAEFDWTFDRLADRAVIARQLVNGHHSFHVLVFWKRSQESNKNLFDYSASGDFEIVEN